MYNTMKRIWNKTHDIDKLRAAVEKKWITEEEFKAITGENY